MNIPNALFFIGYLTNINTGWFSGRWPLLGRTKSVTKNWRQQTLLDKSQEVQDWQSEKIIKKLQETRTTIQKTWTTLSILHRKLILIKIKTSQYLCTHST